MAEGGGFENPSFDPDDYDPNDDDDDDTDTDPLLKNPDDEENTALHDSFLKIVGSSTPEKSERFEMQTIQHEKSGKPSYIEYKSGKVPSVQEIERRLKDLRNFNTGLLGTEKVDKNEQLLSEEEKEKEIQKVKDFIKKEYPEVDFDKLGKISFATKGNKLMDVVVVGPGGGETKIIRDDGSGLLKNFLKLEYVKKALGRKAIDIDNENLREMKKQRDEIEKQQKEKQKELEQRESMAKESEKLKNEINEKRNKTRQIIQHIDSLEDTHGPLNKEVIEKLKLEKNDLQKEIQEKAKQRDQLIKTAKNETKLQEDFRKLTQEKARLDETIGELQEKINTEDLNEKKERKAELERLNEEDRLIIDDEESSPSDKEAAQARIDERQEEHARLTTEIEERERATPLRERVKEIFKKYGVTVTSILLAAGVTIGAVIGAITNALKSMGKALGNGLKEIGKKTASLLPGLIGSIVSFLFKTAGQAIGFLAEHTWLLILAVVAFLVDSYVKKQR